MTIRRAPGQGPAQKLQRILREAETLDPRVPDEAEPLKPEAPNVASAALLLTAEEVAALLQVKSHWVYERTRRKAIPHVQLGRHYRYRRESIEAWLRDREQGT